MKTTLLYGIALAAWALHLPLSAQNEIEETRDVLDQWVETRQILSEEKSAWRTEKTILEDTEQLLASELERLEDAIADLEDSATAADEERASLNEEKERLAAASSVVEDDLGGLETRMKAIVAKLPEPLVEKIKPLIRRLPEDAADTDLSLGERVQNVVGILSQTDKFNTSITLSSESQERDGGKVVQVSTLYWGLAAAYFVDDSTDYAGIGLPSEDGEWTWTEIEGAGPQVKQLLEVYDGSAEIQFIEVPARIR
ncbi:MAG: DUF3450 family protein [Verrucomicrobiota bacterium]